MTSGHDFQTTTTTNLPPYRGPDGALETFTPAFDVFDGAHEYILAAELPGLRDKEQTVIEFTDARTVSIRGRIELGGDGLAAGQSYKVLVRERRRGWFEIDFAFPGPLDVEAVRATLEYGLLRIFAPKAAEAWPRRIQIQ